MAVTPMRVDGIDLHHQRPDPDFAGLKKAGLDWAYHKVTEGDTFKDSKYEARRAAAKKAGLPFGGYHFARADLGDARKEARFFVKNLKLAPGDLRPALDLETPEGLSVPQLKEWCANFIDEVRKLTGVTPVLYCPWDFGFQGVKWVPRYNSRNTQPQVPWDIWQFSNGSLGVPKSIGTFTGDLNHSKIPVSDLLVPKGAGPAPKPAPTKVNTLHVQHVSLQWRDPDKVTRRDIDAAFKRGASIVSFTEVYEGVAKELAESAKALGYQVVQVAGNDAIAVKKGVKVLDHGATLVNEGQKGKPPHGGHSRRHAAWVVVELFGETIFYVTAHWVTGFKNDADRRRKHEKMSTEVVRLCKEHGRGARLAFCAGDINARDDAGSSAGYEILEKGGITTCWDELGVYPSTHGGEHGATIDFIGSWDADLRVSCQKARSWPRVESDHHAISAWFDIRVRRQAA